MVSDSKFVSADIGAAKGGPAHVADDAARKTPPYLAYRTFINYVDGMRDTGVPSRIDRSLLRSMSGTAQSQLLGALAFFGLIDDPNVGTPQPGLGKLVKAEGEVRQRLLRELAVAGYPYLFSDEVDLGNATPRQVEEVLRDEAGISGDTIRKCFVFFVTMAKEAGVTLSSFLVGTRAKNGTTRRRAAGRPAAAVSRAFVEDDEEEVPDVSEGTIPVPEGFIVHPFPLRRDLTIKIALPPDLSAKDVARLHKWLQVLPVEDDPTEG